MRNSVGFGYDIHKLVRNRELFLGGIKIPSPKGLLGHSDADVVLHSISDAILGAAGLEDIGKLFPDTDKRYKNISSVILLKEVMNRIKKRKFKIGNLDVTIICKFPRLDKFKGIIKRNIARALGLAPNLVNIKAKTNQGIGELGRGEAIAAYAVTLLKIN